jgi:L-lactate utilization protein LutC
VNVERLNEIATVLRADLSRTDALSQLQQLVSALQNQVSQPGQPLYEQQVSQFYESLRAALTNSEINSFSPTWQQVLEELGVADLLGEKLEHKIEDIFSRNKITPTIAQQELQQILTEL